MKKQEKWISNGKYRESSHTEILLLCHVCISCHKSPPCESPWRGAHGCPCPCQKNEELKAAQGREPVPVPIFHRSSVHSLPSQSRW